MKVEATGAVNLRESVSTFAGRVDRETCTIYDVRLCGFRSGNGKNYPAPVLKAAIPLYENKRVYFDHPPGKSNARSFGDRFGKVVNVRADDKGLVGNLKYNPKHPFAEQFLHFAEHDCEQIGMSHNAEGVPFREADGTITVKEITVVHSVDIVDGPATTMSLFEQDSSMDENETTVPGDGIEAMLGELIKLISEHPEWDKDAKLAKIKEVLGLLEDDEEEEEESSEEGEEEEIPERELMEQLSKSKSKYARAARVKLLRESRRKFALSKGLPTEAVTEVFLEQLVKSADKDVIKLIEDRGALFRSSKFKAPKSYTPTPTVTLTPREIAQSIDWTS